MISSHALRLQNPAAWSAAKRRVTPLGRDTQTPLGATGRENCPTSASGHTETEAVGLGPPTVIRLVGAFGHSGAPDVVGPRRAHGAQGRALRSLKVRGARRPVKRRSRQMSLWRSTCLGITWSATVQIYFSPSDLSGQIVTESDNTHKCG